MPLLLLPFAPLACLRLLDNTLSTTFELTVENRGHVAIARGTLEGDGQFRPIGGVGPGDSRTFVFHGTGQSGNRYVLRLVREDSSRIECDVGLLPPTWDISGDERVEIPDDTCRVAHTDTWLELDRRSR